MYAWQPARPCPCLPFFEGCKRALSLPGRDPTFSLVPLDHQPAITLGLLTLLFLAGLPLAFAFPVDPAAKHLPAQDGCTAMGACAGLLQGRQLVFILCFLDIFRRRHPDHLPPDTAPDRYSPTALIFCDCVLILLFHLVNMGDALRLPTFQDREHIGCAVCIALFCQPDRAQRQVGVILPGDPDDDVPVLPADKPPEGSLEVGRDLFQIPDSLARAYIYLFFTFLSFTFLISGTFKGVILTFN